MKKLLLMLVVLALSTTISCNQVHGEAQNFNELKDQHEKLKKDFENLKSDFDILTWGLAQKGVNLEQIKKQKEMNDKVWDISVDGSPVSGNITAPIVIVEFSDFQCPYCNRIAPEIKAITNKYPDKVALMYKHFPLSFHKQSPAAHAAAIAAQKQNKFWEFRYALAPLFRNLKPETFKEVAKKIGLDMVKFEKDMVLAGENQTKIDKDMKLGMKIGVRGTPSFYVNGKKVEQFSAKLIDKMVKDLEKK